MFFKKRKSKEDSIIKMLESESSMRFLNKQYESVIALTDKILLLDGNNYKVLTMRAMSLENLGYYLDAIDDYNKVLELNPDDANIIGLCGLAYNSIGDYTEAREYLAKAVQKGMNLYATNLNVLEMLSERNLIKMIAEKKKTPENLKRRAGVEFTISNEAINLSTINDNLKEFYAYLKASSEMDPDNQKIKSLIDHYRIYFEEN